MRIHQIGPQQRQFLHELSVVGEIKFRDTAHRQQFERSMGIGENAEQPTINGRPVECVMLPAAYHDSARILLAGTAWTFDLDKVGAKTNEVARRNTHYERPAWCGKATTATGLRGALACPPWFLLSIVAFWSRYITLRDHSRKHRCSAFGTWIEQLPADRAFRTPVQQKRWMMDGGPLKEGWGRDPVRRLDRWRERLGVTKAELAREARRSRSAVVRFFTERHGSDNLASDIREALRRLEARPKANPVLPHKGCGREEVRCWLKTSGRTQAWLAEHIGWSKSRVSRQLSGTTTWAKEFEAMVSRLISLESEEEFEHTAVAIAAETMNQELEFVHA